MELKEQIHSNHSLNSQPQTKNIMLHMQKFTRPSSANGPKSSVTSSTQSLQQSLQRQSMDSELNYQTQPRLLKINKNQIKLKIPKQNYQSAQPQQEQEVFQADISSISIHNKELSRMMPEQQQSSKKSLVDTRSNNVSIEQDVRIFNSSQQSLTLPEKPPKLRNDHKENVHPNIQQVISQQVAERCQKILQSAKKRPPSGRNECQSARQSFQPLQTENLIMMSDYKRSEIPSTPTTRNQSKGVNNSIRKLLRESQENPLECLSTARNMNPLDNQEMMNTARSNLITNFIQTDTLPAQRKSSIRDSTQQSMDSTNFQSVKRRRVSFHEQVEEIEDQYSILNETEDDEEEIDRKFRKYFKVEEGKQEEQDCYDPRVCNMKESDIWKVVYEQLNLKYPRLWETPLSKMDILLEKEFLEVRKLQILDEDLHTQNVQVVEQLEGLYKQNEDLQKEIELLAKKEHDFKRLFQPSKVQVTPQIAHLEQESETIEIRDDEVHQQSSIIDEEDFESQWKRLNSERAHIDNKYYTQPLPLDQSFSDPQQQEASKPQKKHTTRDWESKLNRITIDEQRMLSGDASFMDVNDSFYQQFDTLVQHKHEQPIKVTSVEKKIVLTSHMKAFERQYAKYEEKLKLIEDELLDYNVKSRQLESSQSPRYCGSKVTIQTMVIESPKMSNEFLRSPKQSNQSTSKKEQQQETPQFNKTGHMKNRLSQIIW